MPTIHKPQLDHVSFHWHEQSNQFHKELEALRAQILERSGFNNEFGDPSDVDNAEKDGSEFIRELSGILSLAAAIKIDGGYKPANKLVATLKSIEKDPSLILSGSIEPEALAARREAISAGKRSRVRFGLTSTAPPMRRCLTHDA